MMPELPPLSPSCQAALAAMEENPLELPEAVEAHLDVCPPCSEARVIWLSMEDNPEILAPAGYFEGLAYRIQRKLPARRKGLSRPIGIWLAAAGLLVALGLGTTGFFLGRAVRTPMVEASQPKSLVDTLEAQPETPFYESEDPVTQLSDLTPQEAELAFQRLQAAQTDQAAGK